MTTRRRVAATSALPLSQDDRRLKTIPNFEVSLNIYEVENAVAIQHFAPRIMGLERGEWEACGQVLLETEMVRNTTFRCAPIVIGVSAHDKLPHIMLTPPTKQELKRPWVPCWTGQKRVEGLLGVPHKGYNRKDRRNNAWTPLGVKKTSTAASPTVTKVTKVPPTKPTITGRDYKLRFQKKIEENLKKGVAKLQLAD